MHLPRVETPFIHHPILEKVLIDDRSIRLYLGWYVLELRVS